MAKVENKSLESWIWDAACSIRGAKDASKYKEYILPLIFVKRLCDIFDDEIARISTEIQWTKTKARKLIELDRKLVRFYLPITPVNPESDSTWSVIRKLSSNIGQELTSIIRSVANDNVSLKGIIDRIDFNATTHGQRDIDDDRLSNLIEAISLKRLGLADVEPDIIGRSYEYLIRKFAEGSGQSAGEFYTPAEVGMIMAYIMDAEPGMDVYDPTCWSAGLLIKCELALVEKMKTKGINTFAPARLYGQELTAETWAMAKMNMIIHDMEGDIEIGDTFKTPKLRDATGKGLKKFDRIVANPMWNQPDLPEDIYANDEFGRFPAGSPGGKGDWGWAQHILSSLKTGGRAAIVLDTGGASRGSGNANTNKEKDVRKWFVDRDIIEWVLYLPENLFYNTTAPGIVIFINTAKAPEKKGNIFLINATKEFEKGDPKNYISEGGIKKIVATYQKREVIEKFSAAVGLEEIIKNDYNISPSRYIHTGATEEYRPIGEILAELVEVEGRANEADIKLKEVLGKLGFSL